MLQVRVRESVKVSPAPLRRQANLSRFRLSTYHQSWHLVLTRDEVTAILERLDGIPRRVGDLLYGTGLRLLEALRLRVKDLDFARRQIEAARRNFELVDASYVLGVASILDLLDGIGGTDTYDDLGSGPSFGSYELTTADGGSVRSDFYIAFDF